MPDIHHTSYDEVPYESFPVAGTHPDRLWTLARLPGIEAPALETCRVLELGCAAGGNIIPMAIEMPRAQFVGVDLSRVQIAQGDAAIQAMQLPNIKLVAASVTDVDDSYGQFDYIIAHGIYTWVPTEAQEKILQICKQNLSPRGVAYVSYNALPGWRMRGMIRDLMRYHAMQFAEADKRVAQARSILDFLARAVPDADSAYGKLLKSELELLRSAPDYYILHEHLEELNEPLYFHEFIERAQRHGLQYLADADVSTMMASRFSPQVAETVRRIAPDVIRQEQFMDFLTNRTFRQTLLVHADQPIDRLITVQRVKDLWVSGAARPMSAKPNLAEGVMEKFCTPGGMCVTTPKAITKAALVALAAQVPSAMAVTELLAAAHSRLNPLSARPPAPEDYEALAGDLLHGYAARIVEFHAGPSPFTIEPGTQPRASPLARYQAERGSRVTTMLHESITIPEAIRELLPLLDGSRTLDDVAAAAKARGPGPLSKFADVAAVKSAVSEMARNALIAR
jgi:methyltransferase-like protein/SAM-dependent methyltransferase